MLNCYTDLFPSLLMHGTLPQPSSFHSPQNIVQYKILKHIKFKFGVILTVHRL